MITDLLGYLNNIEFEIHVCKVRAVLCMVVTILTGQFITRSKKILMSEFHMMVTQPLNRRIQVGQGTQRKTSSLYVI